MKEERPDSRSSVTSDPASDLSSDRATPEEVLVKSYGSGKHHKSSLSFGISRLLNDSSSKQAAVAASDTDDDAKSVHSSASGQVASDSVIRVPAQRMQDSMNLGSGQPPPGLGFPTSAYSSPFPWFGSHPFLSKDGMPSKKRSFLCLSLTLAASLHPCHCFAITLTVMMMRATGVCR